MQVVPIELGHVLGLGALEFHHKDPFDRLLIAQALSLEAAVVIKDPVFGSYPIEVLW